MIISPNLAAGGRGASAAKQTPGPKAKKERGWLDHPNPGSEAGVLRGKG
jgi:hypothetical protein